MGASQKKKLQVLSSRFRRREPIVYRACLVRIARKALALKYQANGQY